MPRHHFTQVAEMQAWVDPHVCHSASCQKRISHASISGQKPKINKLLYS